MKNIRTETIIVTDLSPGDIFQYEDGSLCMKTDINNEVSLADGCEYCSAVNMKGQLFWVPANDSIIHVIFEE